MAAARRPPAWTGYAGSAAMVGIATGLGFLGRDHLAAPDQVMLYLVVIMVAAVWLGRGPSLLASVLSIGAYDFFFVRPYYTFAVAHERNLLTFAMMLGAGLLISELTSELRRQEEAHQSTALRARTEEMRSSLLSAVSHDLRTPLAAITGAATTLRDQGAALDATQRSELLSAVCDEAERMERLVANLLDMTRLESGLRVKREWVPLEEVVGAALGRLDRQLGERPIKATLPGDLPLLSADPLLLEQVFVNLFENAVKYTAPRSPIEVSAVASAAAVEIEVADRGPGLPAGNEARVFERFFRGAQQVPGGVGLGLAICRGIVEAHGGTITAANRPGGGAVFRIVLPRVGAAPDMPPDALPEQA